MHPESVHNPDRPSVGETRAQRLARPVLGLQHERGQSVERMWAVLDDQRHAAWLKKNAVVVARKPVILEPAVEVADLAAFRSANSMVRSAAAAGWRTRVTRSVSVQPRDGGRWCYAESLVVRFALEHVRAWGAWVRHDVTADPKATYGWDAGMTLRLVDNQGWPEIVNATQLGDFVAACGDEAGILQLVAAREQRAVEAKMKRETSKMNALVLA
jgi:hypothetical protein